MKTIFFCLVALAAGAYSSAQTTPPAAPSLTVGPDMKGLRFDWEPVDGATRYELQYKPYQNSEFVHRWTIEAPGTWTMFRIPLHLYFWTYAQYRLAACNDSGCTLSEAVPVSSLRRFAVGYFKPAVTSSGQQFAADTDLSQDGRNFVSAAPGEQLSTSSGPRAGGAIYTFRFNAGAWRQRVRLEPSVPPFIEGDNVMKVSISANGGVVALGMPNYAHSEGDEQTGEVFVYRHSGTNNWSRIRLRAGSRGGFGRWVGLNDAGDTLAVARGGHSNPSLPPKVTIYKFLEGVWTPVRDIGNRAGRNEVCDQGVLSADGSTVAESCHEEATATTPARFYVRTHSGSNWTTRIDMALQMTVASELGYGHGAIAIDGTGNTVAAHFYALSGDSAPAAPSEVHVFARNGAVYQRVRTLRPGIWRTDTERQMFGQSIAISGNGLVLAVGDPLDNGLGYGPRQAPLNPGTVRTGAVYVYRYYDDWWYLYNMVKPNYHPEAAPYLTFGNDVEFGGNGVTLIVGERGESSASTGIAGSWSNLGAPGAGAVWLY